MRYTLRDGSTVHVGWDTPGWDWDNDDYSWLRPADSVEDSGWFIHGGMIRHQRHIPVGEYSLEAFMELVTKLGTGLTRPMVLLMSDTGSGDPGFWVEGVRTPTLADVEGLVERRRSNERDDRRLFDRIRKQHPDWK